MRRGPCDMMRAVLPLQDAHSQDLRSSARDVVSIDRGTPVTEMLGDRHDRPHCRAYSLDTFRVQDLKSGNLLNATEDALNLNESNAKYQQKADELAKKEAAAGGAPGHGGEATTAQAVAAQAAAVQTATAPVTNHPAP